MLSEEKEVLNFIKEAFALKEQGLYKPAVEMLYKALAMDNDNIEVLFQLAELYSFMYNYTRAKGYLEQVLTVNPNHLESLKLLQKILEKEEDFNAALDYAKKIFELEKSSENLKTLVKISSKLNIIDKTWINSKYANSDVIFEIAKAMYENGEDAKELLKGDDEQSKILLGKIYFDENELEKSREIFQNFPNTTENAEILNYKGLFALEDMNFTEAIKCFSKASNYAKTNPVYFYNLANAYFFNGWMTEAQKAYSKALYLNPESLDYRYSLAYLYWEIKEFDKCQKEVDAILAINPNHSGARVLKALILNRNNEFMKAKLILEESVDLGYNDDFTLTSLGETYKSLDMFEKAEKVLSEVHGRNPENLDCISDLADVYIKEKEYDCALNLAKKIIQANPNYIYGYVLGAKISYAKKDFEKAKEFAQEALSLDMNCSEGYYYLALVRLEEKDFDEAIECMKRAIIYDAANPVYYAQMSNIYKAKNDIKTALEYISEAESINHSTEYKILYRELAQLNKKS